LGKGEKPHGSSVKEEGIEYRDSAGWKCNFVVQLHTINDDVAQQFIDTNPIPSECSPDSSADERRASGSTEYARNFKFEL
jgi:hypothetical protein